MKSLADWLVHLEGLHPKGQAGIELGLERIGQVKEALGQIQSCPLIVVGGNTSPAIVQPSKPTAMDSWA